MTDKMQRASGRTRKEGTTPVGLRIPVSLLARMREIAELEERPLNMQFVRFIRVGLEQYESPSAGMRRVM